MIKMTQGCVMRTRINTNARYPRARQDRLYPYRASWTLKKRSDRLSRFWAWVFGVASVVTWLLVAALLFKIL